jgi:hypothetical protein
VTTISADALRAADLVGVEAPDPSPEVAVGPGQSAAVFAEAARTDAAFETWMAVAPARATEVPGALEPDEADRPIEEAERLGGVVGGRRWLLPLEIAASLAAVAVLVVVALIVIG